MAAPMHLHAQLCYPRQLARLGITGTTRVHFCVRQGRYSEVRVVKSSGEAALDEAAVGCVFSSERYFPIGACCDEQDVEFGGR